MREDYVLSTLKTTQLYASEIELTFDPDKQIYLGKFVSVRGLYEIEGPNRAEVMYEMDRLLDEEYRLMQREASQRDQGRSRGGGGRSIGGEKVHRIDASEESRLRRNPSVLSKGGSWVELVTGGLALATGRYAEAAMAAASLALGDFFEGVESLWDKNTKKLYAVSFGGVLITATTRRQLRRKLTRQKQKRIQIIMNSVRKMGLLKGSGNDPVEKYKRENNRIRQLRQKKQRALQLGPDKWKKTVSPQGQQTGWRARTLDLRERLRGKKAKAQQLWVERVGVREKMLD